MSFGEKRERKVYEKMSLKQIGGTQKINLVPISEDLKLTNHRIEISLNCAPAIQSSFNFRVKFVSF